MSRDEIIGGMCTTTRHDFGLDRDPEEFLSAGMTADERVALRDRMAQLYDHHIGPALEAAIHAERVRCAEICLAAARGQGDIDRTSAAYQAYLQIMAADPVVAKICKSGKTVEEAIFVMMARAMRA